MESSRPDQRGETGLRTRSRLIDAACDLLAERGEGSVTLREIADIAEANVAAGADERGARGHAQAHRADVRLVRLAGGGSVPIGLIKDARVAEQRGLGRLGRASAIRAHGKTGLWGVALREAFERSAERLEEGEGVGAARGARRGGAGKRGRSAAWE